MSELKTIRNNSSVLAFIDSVENIQRHEDALKLLEVFEQITGIKASMWGSGIIGFGSYHYKSERSTQESDWPLAGFSPRKQNTTVYVMPGFEYYQDDLKCSVNTKQVCHVSI